MTEGIFAVVERGRSTHFDRASAPDPLRALARVDGLSRVGEAARAFREAAPTETPDFVVYSIRPGFAGMLPRDLADETPAGRYMVAFPSTLTETPCPRCGTGRLVIHQVRRGRATGFLFAACSTGRRDDPASCAHYQRVAAPAATGALS